MIDIAFVERVSGKLNVSGFSKSVPAIAATTEPAAVVLSSELDMFVMPNEVVVAFTKYEEEEAKIPFCAQIGEVVAAVITPKLMG